MNRQDAKGAKELPRAGANFGAVLRKDRELGLRSICQMLVAGTELHGGILGALGVLAVQSS